MAWHANVEVVMTRQMTPQMIRQMTQKQKSAFIFGLGFVGVALARLLLAEGWEIRATTRIGKWDKPYASLPDGVRLFAFAEVDGEALRGVTHIISTIAPIAGEDIVLPLLTQHLRRENIWAGYVSATSVYSEADGGWVREVSPTKPISQRGKNRVRAEDAWQKHYQAEVFRAAGIYGRGRSVFDKLRGDDPRIIVKPGHFFNRIHVTDLGRVITAAMHNPSPNRILNCADGHPSEAGDVTRFASGLLGVAPPPEVAFADADMSPMARSFYATSRKVDSSRIKTELGIDLLYPSYQQGLQAVWEEENGAAERT